MKRILKSIKKLVKNLSKDKWNIIIFVLMLLVFVLGTIIVGIVKTIIIVVGIALLVIAIRFGGMFIMAKKKKKKKEVKRHTKHKKKWKKTINLVIIICLLACIIGIVGGLAFMGYVVIKAPKFDKAKLYYKEASILYDSNNEEIIRIGKEMRDKITYDEIPQVFIDAIVATEDSRFFEHNGLDLPRFLKATAGQALGKNNAGGASTISMQVIKNNFTSTKKSIVRKLADIYLAVFKLEKAYTKEQILEFYVNDIHMSVNNVFGIAETSRALFGKEIGDINLSQAALLAGMFQAPSAYNPYRFPEKAAARRSTVLYLMERHGYITTEERKIADKIPIESLIVEQQATSLPYQSYIDYAVKEVEEKTGYDPLIVPMRIYTNLDTKKQDYLNDILNGVTWKWENDVVQSGVAVTDVNTGAVLALGDHRNETGAKLWSLASEIKKQVGSTAKPIFDYGPGMEFNNWSTYTPFVDDRYTYSDGKTINDWDGKFFGMQTLRYALTQSRNIPALKAFQQVDNKKIIEFVQSLGITPEISGGMIHEAHAIGGFNGASPLQFAVAYAAFANGGYYIAPFSVNKIEFMDTNETTTYTPEKVRVMSDSTAYMITNVLKFGVDNRLISGGKVAGVEVAAKSGTSNYADITKEQYKMASNAINDLWYAGYSPDTAISMWYGYDKLNSKYYNRLPASSGIRDRLFTALASGLFEKNGKKFTMPSSVVSVTIENGTIPAMLPSANTPKNLRITEIFKKGTEPTEVSPRFNTLPNATGLDIKKEGSNVKLSWNSATAPNMISDEYLVTIGRQKEKYITIRKNEDASILGTFGYNVYIKNAAGQLTLLGWTDTTSYTHTPTISGTLTYVVKTCYSTFKDSESTGATTTLSDNPYVSIPIINLKGKQSDTIHKNSVYTDAGFTVLVDSKDVTSSVTNVAITVKNADNTDNNTYTRINDIVLDTTTVGEKYTITYKITYGTAEETLTRTIEVVE